ncbi:MAG: hypothetical protein KatS3mg015_0662 [Fimbriimonadales bacterium]|nr:MAG: hypothetical protein KatS3mg015_0662 [Fimbriimonadales bacterium]
MALSALLAVAAIAFAVPPVRVLALTETAGYRHEVIPHAVSVLRQIAAKEGFVLEVTGDSGRITDGNLTTKDVVVFLLTTGDILNSDEEAALQRFIRSGGGFVGIHSAADTEYEWEWYGRLVGAYFRSHPPVQRARVIVEQPTLFSMRHMPVESWWEDEWYDYRQNPRGRVTVLARVDESSYSGGVMGEDHPIVWQQDFDGGRSWYTGLGHTASTWDDARFQLMLRDAILLVARRDTAK